MKLSTENVGILPDIETLKRVCQSITLLDAILQPTWDLRYFSFDLVLEDRGVFGEIVSSAVKEAWQTSGEYLSSWFRLSSLSAGTFDGKSQFQ